jgi:dihydroorotate dehydrogenase (fumarate)
MTDLTTRYLGLTLKNPLVASASPITKKIENARKLEDAGVGAIVVHSLFEEQIIHESLELDHYLSRTSNSSAEADSYFPEDIISYMGPSKHLDHLAAIKRSVSIPVIASLNGVSRGGWTRYAHHMQDAGADAIELNLYYLAADPELTSQELENAYVNLVAEVKSSLKIPLSVKLSPFATALPNLAKRLSEAGADGIVLFNRFYQPDFDLEELEIVNTLILSNSDEMRLPLRWIGILYGQIKADMALTSGVHTGTDVLKAMMAGAKVTMLASEILMKGYGRIPELITEIETWMQEHKYESIFQMQGSMSKEAAKEPAAFERANYMKVLASFKDLP